MKSLKSSGSFMPFENLDKILKNHSKQSRSTVTRPYKQTESKPSLNQNRPNRSDENIDHNDEDLFMKAMAGVEPLIGPSRQPKMNGNTSHISDPETPIKDAETDAALRLDNLVKHGDGFIVEHTPEYKEWTGFKINPQLTKRLHRGDFAIQEYIDLHGLNVHHGKIAFDAFLKESIETRKQAILIVHGRGLSSPYEPVLKSKVYEWLTSGQWNKWIVAFTSARLVDGGAGATYVLLRPHPLPKRFKKSKGK